jgi:hypothetical protein
LKHYHKPANCAPRASSASFAQHAARHRDAQPRGKAAQHNVSEHVEKRTAQLLSRIDAPQFQRVREGTSFNNAATDLSLLANQGRGDDFLTQLRLARSGPDPGVQALADFGGAYGMSRAKRMKPAAPNLYTLTPNESADITRGFRP